jgi:hypothetical protein
MVQEPVMNRCPIYLLLLLLIAACQSAQPAAPASQPPAKATEPAPVFVPALCTLMGLDARSEVPAGHPVILIWGWSAATEEQIQDYLRAGRVVVTFDGTERAGKQQGGAPYDQTAKVYRVVWMAEVGIPNPGLHTITYSQTFSAKVFDGSVYYGPGTKNEKQEDACEIVVK